MTRRKKTNPRLGCRVLRQNDEKFCSTCTRRWSVVEDAPACERRKTTDG